MPNKHALPSGRYTGWVRQQPDFRDWKFAASPHVLAALPPSVDLTAGMGPTLDQQSIGSCGPNAEDSLLMFDQGKQGLAVASASRLFLYYTTRQLMGTVSQDSGVDNRTLLKACAQYGFCDESLWPYDVAQFTTKPPTAAYAAALPNRITSYAAVSQTLDGMKGCLASGLPFLFGFTVYASFESATVTRTGVVPMPQKSEQVLGGHDVCFVGFDDATQRFKFKNSWNGWGENNSGYGYFPYAYALDPNLSGDFWVVNAVPGGSPVPPPPPGPTPPPPGPARLFTFTPRQAVHKGGSVTLQNLPVALAKGLAYQVFPPATSATDGDHGVADTEGG